MAETTVVVPAAVQDRLALALDVDDLVAALRMARELKPYFGVAKVGLELFSANGPDAVAAIAECGYKVFLDVKLHDIPTTVGKAARVLGALGASYLTLHAFGGVPMLRAGVEGLAEGAAAAGLDAPTALAVTILTSDDGAPPHVLGNRVRAAVEGGCGGLVCAAGDVREAKQLAPRLVAVVPGIRHEGTAQDDQARSTTPRNATDAGADLLVIGRAVTAAKDRVAAAAAIVAEIS
ncbi:MAG: orotidine-5-phosphate decarboxylase [Actinomycetota bacterium]|jgi:orotidine-5'-phosphate decarboxylase|nr:orotidine-5-phosphate decarboxylase [Actinomycetota bacterium]